jgi:hypothetical protein
MSNDLRVCTFCQDRECDDCPVMIDAFQSNSSKSELLKKSMPKLEDSFNERK